MENTQEISDYTINEEKLTSYRESLKSEQNILNAVLGGLVAALVGATIWAVITVLIKFQIGYMAVGVGFLVGFVVRYTGKGIDPVFGIIGAVFSILGCLAGNYFSTVSFIAENESMAFFDTLALIDVSVIPSLIAETFSFMDLLFYSIAVYEGYRFSFRVITEQELIDHAGELKKKNEPLKDIPAESTTI